MSTSTAINVTTPKVEITDSTLLFLHQQDEKLVSGMQQAFEQEYPQWEVKHKKAQEFKVEVNNYGSDLDHKRIVVPAVSQLKEEREVYLNQYWDFIGTCEKMVVFSHRIQTVMTLLSPRPRSYAEWQNLENEQPHLAAQIKSHEQTCIQHIEVLGKSFAKVDALQKKMVTFLKTDTAVALKRFCVIVDNEGLPLSTVQWAALKITSSPAIPLPQARKGELSPASLETTSTGLGSTIPPKPLELQQQSGSKTEDQAPPKKVEGQVSTTVVKVEDQTLPKPLELQQQIGSKAEDQVLPKKVEDQVPPPVVGVENQTKETAPTPIETDVQSQTNPVPPVKTKVSDAEPVDLTKGVLNDSSQPSTQKDSSKEIPGGGKKQNKKNQDATLKT